MNYRHIFHAGNLGDVFKHAVLCALLDYFQQKDKPFCYIDTHSGIGLYDLQCGQSRRSPEYLKGIAKIFNAKNLPSELKSYLEIISSYQSTDELSIYPGSPAIAQHYLRPQDHMILNEYHPEDFITLKNNLGKNSQIHYHHRDAYEFLPAILPPSPRRALILIDPPFEGTEEFDWLITLVEKMQVIFPQGVYAIWYPIVTNEHKSFLRTLKKICQLPLSIFEFALAKPNPENPGLVGCGMAIINPPWKIENSITTITQYLLQALRQ